MKLKSLRPYDINNGKMNITGLSGRISGVKMIKLIQAGISDSGRWN